MHYIKINNYILNLDDISVAYAELSDLKIVLKNGTTISICFHDVRRRDEEIKYLWLSLQNK